MSRMFASIRIYGKDTRLAQCARFTLGVFSFHAPSVCFIILLCGNHEQRR